MLGLLQLAQELTLLALHFPVQRVGFPEAEKPVGPPPCDSNLINGVDEPTLAYSSFSRPVGDGVLQ